jgi:hypothetical protein
MSDGLRRPSPLGGPNVTECPTRAEVGRPFRASPIRHHAAGAEQESARLRW